jgi:ATP-binding cassette subfamily F protein uup
VEDVRRVIRASLGNRAKESLLVDFINQTDLDQIGDKASVIEAFFTFAQAEQQREAQELITAENLNAEAAKRYISTSLKREFASENGTELNAVLPKMSPLNPQYLTKKQSVFQKIAAFVEKFKGVGLTLALETAAPQSQEGLLAELTAVQHALELEGGWAAHVRVEQAIERFSLDAQAQVAHLSGGAQKRLALARGLAQQPDVLLLDEPTNHLDIAAIEWLESVLVEERVSLLFVTHDRGFLDRLATRIIELDRGKLVSFPGDYAQWQRRKEARLNEEVQAFARADQLLGQEEAWIRKGVEARRTRAVFRVERLHRLREERMARRDRLGRVQLHLDSGTSSGKLVAELHKASKSFDGRPIVHDFSARLMRGDKIGIIGPNGCGKTTLLRLILGEYSPDSGRIRRGSRLDIAYFDQMRAQLDPQATLIDVISPGSDTIEIAGKRKHVISYLEDFLFAPQRARSPVKTLSGGERNRLLLARLFARPANVLVLDEPTNDLDIETLELLEQLLQDYTGTLFLVSHDRVFLDNVVTQVIACQGEGRWQEHAGGYTDWQAIVSSSKRIDSTPAQLLAPKKSPEKGPLPVSRSTPLPSTTKLSWKESRELDALPEQISGLETEQAALVHRLQSPELHQGDSQTAQQIAQRLTHIEEELIRLLERWEALESRQVQAQPSRIG